MGWGKVADIATAQNQLVTTVFLFCSLLLVIVFLRLNLIWDFYQIGASFHMMNVSLFVVDLKKVQPFGGPVISHNDSLNSSPFRHGQSSRKSFSKETQLNMTKPP